MKNRLNQKWESGDESPQSKSSHSYLRTVECLDPWPTSHYSPRLFSWIYYGDVAFAARAG